MVPGACATGGGSPPRASLLRGIPTSAPAARAGSRFRFSRGGHTWHDAPGQGGTAAAKSGPRGGCSGAGPGARWRGRGGAGGAEQGERPEARARRRRGRDGAERGGRRAASPGKCGQRGRGAPGGARARARERAPSSRPDLPSSARAEPGARRSFFVRRGGEGLGRLWRARTSRLRKSRWVSAGVWEPASSSAFLAATLRP